MNARTLRFSSLLIVMSFAAMAVAHAAADFAGTWTLNTKKGQNLGMVAAIQESIAVAQTAEKLTIDFTSTFQGNTTKRQVVYDLTGKPVPNEGAMGDKAETVARWDGDKLVVTWTGEGAIAGSKVVKTETRELSADGKTMTVITQRGERPPMELVYEKK